MHLEIKDNTIDFLDRFFDKLYPWRQNGFFVATIGEKAYDYLSGQVFSLHDLTCCSPATCVNVKYFSDYKQLTDDKEALQLMESDTLALAKSCEKKQLYVLSETEDIYTAEQCCTFAKNNGEKGFSTLITHKRIKKYPYFEKIQAVHQQNEIHGDSYEKKLNQIGICIPACAA